MTLLPAQHWARSMTITALDIDYITNLLLEKETPMSSTELAIEIVKKRMEDERSELEARYEGTTIYTPSAQYAVGDRLLFSQMDNTPATVTQIREGNNPNYGEFSVIGVKFDNDKFNIGEKQREFASNYPGEHTLSIENTSMHPAEMDADFSAEDIIRASDVNIIEQVDKALKKNKDLVQLAGTWFVRALMVETDIGHLHLAEAILDINEGGPLTTTQILEEIGGIGDAPQALQIFSLNYAMNEDQRFDEVGPSGEVLWYLNRLEPRQVLQVPAILQYKTIAYDRSLLSNEMIDLEYELLDEHSEIKEFIPDDEVSITLIYPHRRVGTLPINAETSHIFPGAKTPRIAITIVDGLDGEEFPCWIVHEHRYVYGLSELYQKHHLPVGAYVYLEKSEDPGKIIVEFDSYRPRTEWIPLVDSTANDQLHFTSAKRAIGADYDEMIIVGVDSLQEVDKLGSEVQKQQKPLASLLRSLIRELSAQTPQKTVHAKVLYSTINILRRCPPGPIFATLVANPDFENVGGHYWKLSD